MDLAHFYQTKKARIFLLPNSETVKRFTALGKPVGTAHDNLPYVVGMCIDFDVQNGIVTNFYRNMDDLYVVNGVEWNEFQKEEDSSKKLNYIHKINHQDIISAEFFFNNTIIRKN